VKKSKASTLRRICPGLKGRNPKIRKKKPKIKNKLTQTNEGHADSLLNTRLTDYVTFYILHMLFSILAHLFFSHSFSYAQYFVNSAYSAHAKRRN
jgi:hypothetical protein